MSIFSPAPQVPALVCWVGNWSKAHCGDSRFFDAEFETYILHVDSKDRSITHLRVVYSHMMSSGTYVPPKYGERVDVLYRGYTNDRDKFGRATSDVR